MSENASGDRDSQSTSLLQLGEYLSLGASVAGLAVAAVTRQFLFAAVPASLSMCVSVAKRRQFEAQLSDELRSLTARTETLVERAKSDLSEQYAQLVEQSDTLRQATATDREQHQTEIRSLSETLGRVQAHIDKWEQQRESWVTQLQALETLSDASGRAGDRLAGLERDRESSLARLRSLEMWQTHSDENNQRSREAISALQADINARLADLENQSETSRATHAESGEAIAADLNALQDMLTTLQSQQAQGQEAWAEVAQSLDQLTSDSNTRLNTLDTALRSLTEGEGERQLQLADLIQWQVKVTSGLNDLIGQVGRRDELNASLESTRADLDVATTQLAEFQRDLEQVSARLTNYSTELESINRDRESGRDQVDRVSATVESLQRKVQDIFSHGNESVDRDRLSVQSFQDSINKLSIRVSRIEDKPSRQENREPKDINLGIDFGTSFSKVCLRDIAQERSEIVTFDLNDPDLNNALLPTTIGVLKDGRLIAGVPLAEWQAYEPYLDYSIEFIKMRLAELDLPSERESWRLDRLDGLDNPTTVENLCAFYLSQVIRRSRQWIQTWRSELVDTYRVRWSTNIGVPVQYCDSPALQRFEYVLDLAWILSESSFSEPFHFETLNAQMMPFRLKLNARESSLIDCHAVPEIAAEVWSFIKSSFRREGHYAFYDIGDGTLDGGSFQYIVEDGEPKIDFFYAEVQPLGITAIAQQLARELERDEAEILELIRDRAEDWPDMIRSTESRRAVEQIVARVVMRGKKTYQNHRPYGALEDLQDGIRMFIGGGGSLVTGYQKTILETHHDFQQDRAGISRYVILNIPYPQDLSSNGLETNAFCRFAVAYGLSIPDGENPTIRLPKQMQEAEPNLAEWVPIYAENFEINQKGHS